MQNSYKLARTRRHVIGMSCGSRNISQNSYKYRINSYKIARVCLYFAMNFVDMSCGTRRTVLKKKTLVTQLVDICGDMWRVITRANSSHIVGKLVTVGQGLNGSDNTRRVKKAEPEWKPEDQWSCKRSPGILA